MGKDYPLGYPYFRSRVHAAFASQAELTKDQDIEKAIARAHFVKNG